MKKRNYSSIIICLLMTILMSIIIFSKEVTQSVGFSISIWKDNLFPSLFPFFVISNLLIEYKFINLLSKSLGNCMPKLFGLSKETSFVFFISLISGFPSSAKYTSKLVQEEIISKEEGEQLLTFTHFANPLFILSFIGTTLLNNKNLAFLILFCHITSNLIIGIISKKDIKGPPKRKNIQVTNTIPSFGTALSKSILDALNTLFLLLGIITCFLVVSTIIKEVIPLDETTKVLLSGILEMTQGIKLVNEINISIFLKGLFILSFLSFGGLSIHMQVLSFISEAKLRYFPYFWARIIQVVLSIVLYIILFPVFIK